ncbi:TetR family transcriptional regulator [Mycobacterium sp. SWH-M5]|nr:TetR family transcriptional regulator [Mycobacterium sp. SWH-M5]
MAEATTPAHPPAERILAAAADLLRRGGIDAVSTRAVATEAGVQPPTIYRQFGDKDGLLDAVTRHVLQHYIDRKRLLTDPDEDPAVVLRELWDLHVEFGLQQPHCYLLTYGQAKRTSAADETVAILTEVISRLGAAGRLTMSVGRATNYFRSTGAGFVTTQLSLPPEERDPDLSRILFENTLAAISTDGGRVRGRKPNDVRARAVALREVLPESGASGLSAAEQSLLAEWLNRLADQA